MNLTNMMCKRSQTQTIHTVLFQLYKIVIYIDRKWVSGCPGMGKMNYKVPKETFRGAGYVQYLDYDGSLINIHVS